MAALYECHDCHSVFPTLAHNAAGFAVCPNCGSDVVLGYEGNRPKEAKAKGRKKKVNETQLTIDELTEET